MKWFRYVRGVILGVAMIAVALTEGGFGSTWSAVVTVLFVVVGLALVALMVWAATRDVQRARLESTSVPETPDAGMGYFRRERAEQAAREGTGAGPV
jgi:Na+(H+)/acetate symporter ActP